MRPVPFTTGHDPLAGVQHPHALGRVGDDFYALRPYVVGDDLRRIHWPSTARHDELLVRQQEQPWQGRTTVLLDVRRAAHDASSLEAAVSAAASIVTANSARRDLVRLATTDGADSGFGSGSPHLQALLEHLAVVEATGSASLRAMLDLVQRDGQGALVRGGRPDGRRRADVHRPAAPAVRDGDRRPRGQRRRPPGRDAERPASASVIRVDRRRPFAAAWNRAMAADRASRPGVARSAR